jgi:hypothetical protein
VYFSRVDEARSTSRRGRATNLHTTFWHLSSNTVHSTTYSICDAYHIYRWRKHPRTWSFASLIHAQSVCVLHVLHAQTEVFYVSFDDTILDLSPNISKNLHIDIALHILNCALILFFRQPGHDRHILICFITSRANIVTPPDNIYSMIVRHIL